MHTRLCEWFAGCTREAIGTTQHPILGAVPVCGTCASMLDLPVKEFS